MEEMDVDGDGVIEFHEFVAGAPPPAAAFPFFAAATSPRNPCGIPAESPRNPRGSPAEALAKPGFCCSVSLALGPSAP